MQAVLDPACPDRHGPEVEPHIVLGITSAQTCLVLTGRLRALREAGFRVTLVSSPGELLKATGLREGIETRAIAMCREIAPLRDVISLLALWRLMRALRPEVVEFSTPKAGLLGMLAALLAGVPRRVYFLRGLKLETTVGWERRILLAAERLASLCAHTVMCNSNSLRELAIALRIAPAQKLLVLGAGTSVGVDTVHYTPGPDTMREPLGIAGDAIVLGFVGRLTRDKGVPELMEAFEVILSAEPRAWLLLVGWFDASQDALDIVLRARILAHPRITCTGFVPDAAPYYRAMDMMILPTLREGFPNAVLEASSSGVAVITTLSTGARDAVVPEVTGLLVPPGYPAAIAEAALRLLKDAPLRESMGAAGRTWVQARFAKDQVLSRNVGFYEDLLKPAHLAHGSALTG